jgi:hypothetical protein
MSTLFPPGPTAVTVLLLIDQAFDRVRQPPKGLRIPQTRSPLFFGQALPDRLGNICLQAARPCDQ